MHEGKNTMNEKKKCITARELLAFVPDPSVDIAAGVLRPRTSLGGRVGDGNVGRGG
jgi:hypothetical protein